jgi:membrane-bound ClpP family serine protease
MLAKNNANLVSLLILFYFSIALTQVVAELVLYQPLIYFSRIVTPILLIILYKLNSDRQNPFFFLLITLTLATNVIFVDKESPYWVIGSVISILQKIIMLLFVMHLIAKNKYWHIILAAIPFLLIFFYLNLITDGLTELGWGNIFVQSILVSIIGGFSLAAYLMSDNRQNSWLLISTLLFVGLQFVIFIERYYSSIISVTVFTPIALVLNAFGFFTFYKFVVAAEKKDKNYV